jgi:hypothetical protein
MIIRVSRPYPPSDGLDTSHLQVVSFLEVIAVSAVLDTNQDRIIRASIVFPTGDEHDIAISEYQEFARKTYKETKSWP